MGRQINIKVAPQNLSETIETIESEWKKVYGSEPFNNSFLDETYEKQYASDERAATIIGYFTILAIIIACMGLFALSSFMAVRRTKEIGVRKALGAFHYYFYHAFRGIYQMDSAFCDYCQSHRLVRNEQVAADLCLPNRARTWCVYPCGYPGPGHWIDHCRLAGPEIRSGQPCRSTAL